MSVVVTGGLGVNGSWTVRALLEAGCAVTVVDRSENLALLGESARDVSILIGDITDGRFIDKAITEAEADVIVHMASLLAQESAASPGEAVKVNCGGSWTVFESAARLGVGRVVYASSLSVYAPFEGKYGHPRYIPVGESFPRAPHGSPRVYGATKVLEEDLAAHMESISESSFVGLRFAQILSPVYTSRHSGSSAQLRVIRDPFLGRAVYVERGGEQRVDFLYIGDLARSVVRACLAEGDVGGVYNIGSGVLVTLEDVALQVRKHVPNAVIEIGAGLDFMELGPIYGLLDIARARDILGYEPYYSLERTVEEFAKLSMASPS